MRVDWLMGGCCRPDRGGKLCPPRRAHPRLVLPEMNPPLGVSRVKWGSTHPQICGRVPVPWYDRVVGFSLVGNTSVRLNHPPVGWKPRSFSGIFVPVNGSRTAQRRQAMLTSSKLALSLVFVLAAASAGMAAPKQPVRPNNAIHHQVPAGS